MGQFEFKETKIKGVLIIKRDNKRFSLSERTYAGKAGKSNERQSI